jgi:hypothetical protein
MRYFFREGSLILLIFIVKNSNNHLIRLVPRHIVQGSAVFSINLVLNTRENSNEAKRRIMRKKRLNSLFKES